MALVLFLCSRSSSVLHRSPRLTDDSTPGGRVNRERWGTIVGRLVTRPRNPRVHYSEKSSGNRSYPLPVRRTSCVDRPPTTYNEGLDSGVKRIRWGLDLSSRSFPTSRVFGRHRGSTLRFVPSLTHPYLVPKSQSDDHSLGPGGLLIDGLYHVQWSGRTRRR